MKTILKLLTALAAIAGVVYVIATFGDKIVAWAKGILPTCDCKCDGECTCGGECTCNEEDIAVETPAEEAVEEVVEEEVVAEEAPVVDEGEPVAEEADFEA